MNAPANIRPMLPRDHSPTVHEVSDSYATATPAERNARLRELSIANAAFMDGFRAGMQAAVGLP